MSKFVLDPGAGDLGDGGGCQGWVVQALFGRSRTVPCGTAGALGVCSGFFGFRRPVEWVRAVLPGGSCLLGRARGSFPLGVLGASGSFGRRSCSGCATGVLTGEVGSVLVLLVSGCCGCFWIFCSGVLERSK